MADDQVKYSDLIADDVVKGLEVLNQALQDIKTTMAGVKSEAASLGIAIKTVSTATREQQQATAQNAANVERLSKKMKDLSEEERKVEEIKRRYKKLTDEQIQSVNAFQQALRGNTASILAAVNAIDVENKSYNELNAMYNTLKDSLNAMTVAERQNTEAGKAMTAQSNKIYDTMNELQKATGKYTLQVGKYRAAFDGLGYSFQQIIREAPSALNLNQFFLAISNNIPFFVDQLKAFKDEQKEIKANLASMTEGTKEYAEQQAKQMSVGKKLMDSILSWQTAILVGVMLLRSYGSDVINWIGSLFSKTKKADDAMKQFDMTMRDINRNAADAVKNASTELGLLMSQLDSVTKGTDEWKNLVERVNEITGETLDYQKTMPDEIRKVTKAYLDQALVIEKNKQIVETLAKSQMGRNLVSSSIGNRKGVLENENYSPEDIVRMMGLDPKEQEELIGGIDFYRRFNNSDEFYAELLKRAMDASGVMSLDAEGMLSSQYKNAGAVSKKKEPKKKNQKPPKDQVADLLTLQRELEDAIISNIENEFEREEAAEIARHNRFIEDKQKELELVKGDAGRAAVINKQIEEEQNTHDTNMLNIDEKYRQVIIKRIEDQKKREEQAQKEAERLAKEKIQQEEKDFKANQEIEKRKFELIKHTATEEKKFVMEQQMELLQWRIDHAEALGISPALLDVMKEEYAQMKKMYDLGRYSTGKQNIKGNYTSISDLLWPDLDSDQTSALNSVFDQAKEALNSWMDARKAAADQAKELADDEVSAAENALNREIELRNQGYANDVALREKELADAKAAQKKAAEEQKKVAQEQVLLDAALQTSSMITASANIIKQFPNPLAWAPMLALMWGTFAYAKTKAYQASTKSIKFKEGGVMLLDGGSHESGHDVNLGIGPDGSNLRAEGGEYFAVINKRSSRKYGSQIPAVVNALNSGMFEDRYIKTSDAIGMLPQVIRADDGTMVDLSRVESGVSELVKQGESRWTVEGEYRVMRYKNLTRRVRVS